MAASTRARRAKRTAAASAAVIKTPSHWARSSQGSGSAAVGLSRSPITVMVRSPSLSIKVTARRVGASRQATCSSNPSAWSSAWARSPSSSRPRAVKNWALPTNLAICAAITAPPPAGCCRLLLARMISPGAGKWSTQRNSTHSTWPTTAICRGGRWGSRGWPRERFMVKGCR